MNAAHYWNANGLDSGNREESGALRRILAMLVVMVQGDGGTGAARVLPRHLHRFLLRLVRPAEAATRRLVIVAARGVAVRLSPPRSTGAKPRPALVENGLGQLVPAPPHRPARPAARNQARLRAVSLPMFDPLPRRGFRRYVKPSDVPRIRSFDDIRVPLFRQPCQPDPPPPSADDRLDATRLHRRIDAIGRVLEDLPRQAKRFARWQARRDARLAQERDANLPTCEGGGRPSDDTHDNAWSEGAQPGKVIDAAPVRSGTSGRPFRVWPMRPGRPPGWRRRPGHPVDGILNDLHGLAFSALERPDTS